MEKLQEWIQGSTQAHSKTAANKLINIDKVRILHKYKPTVTLSDCPMIAIPSNDVKAIIGTKMTSRINNALENDESPLQHKTAEQCSEEIQTALRDIIARLRVIPNIRKDIADTISEMLHTTYASMWKAKYDLTEPAALPPMVIELMPGAVPTRVRRKYNWTREQYEFVKQLLSKQVDVGIISRVTSPWCCPIVLVIKPDLTWRLCVDPSNLNKYTVPMTWDIPRTREQVQHLLRGVRWMCKFDFVSMFWQIPLHEDSRRLFCFHAGDLGVFQFNRVAMGAMNSSIYTQRVMTMIFRHVHRKDGRCLLHNGLIIMTDDVLLYAKTQEEMVEILGLFMHTTCCHHLSCHPGKVGIMLTSTIFCGLKITRQGITVDPDRLAGLMNVSPPRNLGDVWQFNAAVGWIREDIPLFSEASAVLSELVHKALKTKTRRNMAAARRITLEQAGWTQRHQDAWDTIKRSMMQTITTAYRDKRMRACIFTDACDTGWAYAITQCNEG